MKRNLSPESPLSLSYLLQLQRTGELSSSQIRQLLHQRLDHLNLSPFFLSPILENAQSLDKKPKIDVETLNSAGHEEKELKDKEKIENKSFNGGGRLNIGASAQCHTAEEEDIKWRSEYLGSVCEPEDNKKSDDHDAHKTPEQQNRKSLSEKHPEERGKDDDHNENREQEEANVDRKRTLQVEEKECKNNNDDKKNENHQDDHEAGDDDDDDDEASMESYFLPSL
eukprot:TRINITY_DN2405_c0_g3_i1.p1 TRINITY_DN2405_c0_g3~~TRINITY_DN2405_c0_g3_i1.p1  ORF type:complete len:225 (+),score=69.65 TRINITY_DN2405_c0_g3_i1:172-846(+)